jgi:hypothetical protein
LKNNIISAYNYYKGFFFIIKIVFIIKVIHSVMKNEIVTLLKTVGVVVVGVLLANAIERKFLSSKVDAPMQVPATK